LGCSLAIRRRNVDHGAACGPARAGPRETPPAARHRGVLEHEGLPDLSSRERRAPQRALGSAAVARSASAAVRAALQLP
jgi:hypothetical protein